MHRMKILGVSGSLQRRWKNRELLLVASSVVPPGVDLVLFDGLRDLLHFNPDIDPDEVPEGVHRWRQALSDSDAVLIASPEYGFSLPGSLKNGIDWVIGSGELEERVVAITAAVPGPSAGGTASRRSATPCLPCGPGSLVEDRFRSDLSSSVRLRRWCRP